MIWMAFWSRAVDSLSSHEADEVSSSDEELLLKLEPSKAS